MSFDYLIIGGGLAGLVVAARLSEDASVTVCVLEAGGQTNIPDVEVPGYLRNSLGKPALDWMFFSTPQSHAAGQQVYMPRGKGLGGSSMLNFMILGRTSSGDYDGIEALGNTGWNWTKLLNYSKKSESATSPSDKFLVENHLETQFDSEYHGKSGPVSKTLPRWICDFHMPFIEALNHLGVPYNPDPGRGDNIGVSTYPVAIHPEHATRSYSSSAYYEPNKDRKNLHVITGAQVTRVILTRHEDGEALATGVEYVKEGKTLTVNVVKEVVLSAGAFQTPQILELSGIGDSKILSQQGITPVVDLPGVGTNLQDHPWVPIVFEMTSKYVSMEALARPGVFEEYRALYETQKRGMFSSVPTGLAFLPLESFTDEETRDSLSRDLAARTSHATDGFAAQMKLQRAWLTDKASAQLEMSAAPALFVPPGLDVKAEPGATYMTLTPTVLHPISRGSVHIQSNDPLAPPAIDPAYFEDKLDLEVIVHGLKYARKIAATDVLRAGVVQEVYPGEGVKTDDELREFAKKSVGSLFHPVGSAAMRPREHGGVVSPKLVVYGTRNLRVADASIIPLQLGGHPQSAIYAIAEKAADLLKS